MRIGGVNNMKKYKIAVAGTGYVGLSIATLLSQHHHETAVDIIPEKVEMINNRKSPIQDDYIEKYLAEKELNLTVTLDAKTAYADDTIIVDTIEPLWNTDMTGKVFGGMLECINDRYRRNVGKNDGDYYLNGGIVFLNLDEVRVGNYERKFTDYITKYGSSLAYLDQDVLNGVVEQEKKVKLPMRYNTLSIYFYATYEQVLKIRRSKSQDFYSKEEFSEAISNPGLVHFTTCFLDGLRPWIKGNQHPYLKTFLKYKEMSPWRDIPLQEDKRSGLVKFRTTMIRKAPRFVLCEVASVLHGVIIPEKNYKRMQERVKE